MDQSRSSSKQLCGNMASILTGPSAHVSYKSEDVGSNLNNSLAVKDES